MVHTTLSWTTTYSFTKYSREKGAIWLQPLFLLIGKSYKFSHNWFFRGQLAFCKKAVVGLAVRRIFWIVQCSRVKLSGVEWKKWIKVISLFTFPHIFYFSLLSLLSHEGRIIYTRALYRNLKVWLIAFCVSISIRSHEALMIYARAFYGNF